MKRRVLSLIMAVIMVLGMFPVTAFAALSDNEINESSIQETSKSTFIEITDSKFTPFVTGLNVEGVEIVDHSEWYVKENSVANQTIDLYVAATDKNGTATISVPGAEGAAVKGEIINATKEIALVDGYAEYSPTEAFWFGQRPMLPGTGDFYGVINVNFYPAENSEDKEVQSTEHRISMKLNDWYTVELEELLPGGKNYMVSSDNEQWQSVEETSYRFYPAGSGEQKAYFRALDENGVVTGEVTLIAEVETPPSEVTVSLSITAGIKNLVECETTDIVMVPVELNVPYFDLGLYGLEDYYYNAMCYSTHSEGDTEYENNQLPGTKETAEGIVTVMHAYIYATEIYYLGYDVEDAGTGASYESGEFEEVLSWSGNAGSSFMNFWDHGTNLNYYVDWTYPLGAPAWGSTSDQIALYGGEDIAIHLIEDGSVQGSNFSFFTLDGTTNVESQEDVVYATQGDKVTLTAVKSQPDWDAYKTYYAPCETEIYWISEGDLNGNLLDWNNSGLGTEGILKTDAQGKITLDTSDMVPGTYYIGALGYVDRNKGTETGPAIIKLELEKAARKTTVTVTVGGQDTIAENTGILYNNEYVYYAKLPFAGDLTISDDIILSVTAGGKEKRSFANIDSNGKEWEWGEQEPFPFKLAVERYPTSVSIVEKRLGDIPGFGETENSVIHLFHVYDKWDRLGNRTLLYTLVVEGEVVRGESIKLDKTEVSMEGGKTFKLTPEITPWNTTYNNITWTSSNTKVAQVASDGTVSTFAKGTAVITAKLPDGMEASCTVNVNTNVAKETVIYSRAWYEADWPNGYGSILKASISGVYVDSYVWYGNNCYVTLDPDYSPDDAPIIFKFVTDNAKVKLNGEPVAAEYFMENGKFVAAITGREIDPDLDYPEEVTKTVYISKTGDFDAAPQVVVSATDKAYKIVGEAYSRNLAEVFKNYDDSEISYTVSVNGGEPVATNENYSFIPEENGVYTLIFTAKNGIGESGTYTATIYTKDEKDTVKIGHEVEGKGTLHWIGITDGSGNSIDGINLQYSEEEKTVYINIPFSYSAQGKMIAYLGMTRTATISGGTEYSGTLSNGYLKQNISFCGQTFTLIYQLVKPETYFELDIKDIPSNGNATYDYLVNRILISGEAGEVVTYQWNTSRVLNILMDQEKTPDNQRLNTQFFGIGKMVGHGELMMENGEATQVVRNDSTYWAGTSTTFTVNFKKGIQPKRIENVQDSITANSPCLEAFETNLDDIFSDADGDSLTYQVKINNGAWTAVEGSVHDFIPDAAKDYVLVYRAYDGFVYSDDTYTISLKATNASTTYDVLANNLPEGAEFYCATGVAEDNTDSIGEKLFAERKEDGSYTVKVPTNVNKIVVICGNIKTSAFVSADNEINVVSFQKTTAVVNTIAGNPADGTISVKSSEGVTILGDEKVFYLVSGASYSFVAVPTEDFNKEWVSGKTENHVITEDSEAEVIIELPVNKPKTITIDADAELIVFYQSSYYVMKEVEPAIVVDNGDGTITYTYSCPNPQQYSMGNLYWATKGDLIDKSGYMMGKNDFVITWEGDERTGDYRAEYNPAHAYGARGDDSVLVNVNERNHLVLEQGETFRLRSFRIWEIINTDTENVMIEPEFIYSGYDENIISMVSANENLTTQYCGTSGNNWMDMTAIGAGTTFLEVGYEAVHIVDGYAAGEWGGAFSQTSNFTFNAIDPNRTALIVIQTDGNAATDVDFGIDGLSANIGQTSYVYDKDKAVKWDAEFDTVYFIDGDHGQISLAPSAKIGSIAKVEISADKGESWKTLVAENGVYTADIYAGNNVIRVIKDDGTTAYQVVRGDKITYDITVVEDIDSDGEADPGDTVRVTLHGLHNPIGKMSGVYNPGFSYGQRVTYTWNGETAQQSGYYQYDFVTNAWVDVVIPENAEGSYSLTDGYIAFNVFGDQPGNHRNMTDGGRPINTTAETWNYTRCLLPEIVVYNAEADTVIGDVNGDGEIDTVDATFIISYYYGKTEFDAEQIKAADVNKDGEVDTVDATFVISYYYGKIESFA